MDDRESQTSSNSISKGGGWITFPFIIGNVAGLTLSGAGWLTNLIVYLIQDFNMKSIDAAQISNIANGLVNAFPIIWAVIADTFLGTFSVVLISSCVSLLGIILLALTTILDILRPESCYDKSGLCSSKSPSKIQNVVMYLGIALAAIGLGGTRFTAATMGANQLHKPTDQGVFFNWYFFTFYVASIISSTAVVYIEDNVGWRWGFGICIGANFIGLAIFLSGYRFYRFDKAQGSPFVALARVVVATARKWKVKLTSASDQDFYYGPDGFTKLTFAAPAKSFSFLNRAALKNEGDVDLNGSNAKPWKLCTVQEVEDFKTLIRIFPLWSTSILLSTPIAIQSSLTVLQALTMNRHLTHAFLIPSSSFLVIIMISGAISLIMIDRFVYPMWQKFFGRCPTPLQRIASGHVLNVLGMVVSALVESKRLKIAHEQDHEPMLAMWLVPQLVLVGIGEAFHFPGQVDFYYQEFPVSLRSTSTAMVAMIIGIAYYLSTGLVNLVRRVTGWLSDDINDGRIDNVYWMLVVIGVLNFGYYLVCAKCYKYQNLRRP